MTGNNKVRTSVVKGDDLLAGGPLNPGGEAVVVLGGETGAGERSAVRFDAGTLGLHSLFLGPSGCGKTNCIAEVLRQARRSMTERDSLLVFDPKGDYLGEAMPGDCIVAVRGNSDPWNIFGEVCADGWDAGSLHLNALEISQTVFAEAIEKSSQPFFPRAAKGVLSDIVATMALIAADDKDFRKRKLNNECLADYLRGIDASRLAAFLGDSPFRSSLKFVGDGSSDQALGVLAELLEVAEMLFMGDFGKAGALSVRQIQRAGGRGLFVEYDVACMSSPAYAVLIDMYLKEALSRSGERGSVFVFLDELPLVPRLQFLQNALTFGRSFGVKVVAGVQSIDQLYRLYGEHGGGCLVAGFQNVFAFRSSHAKTREYVLGLLGECLREVSFNSNLTGKKESRMASGPVMQDDDFLGLRIGEVVASVPYCSPYVFRFDRYGA